MKTTILLLISYLLSGTAQAQTSAGTTNLATVAEAVKIASGLQSGMKESDVDEYLVNRGITCDTNRTYDVYSQDPPWTNYLILTTSYPLKADCCLDLYYWHADTSDTWTNTDKRWERNSLLTEAEIESNWVEHGEPHTLSYGQRWEDFQSKEMRNYIPIKLKAPK